jgi:transposase
VGPDEKPEEVHVEPETGPPAQPPPTESVDIAKLSKTDQVILALKKQGASQRVIAAEVGVSRATVRRQINALIMRGFLSPDVREEEEKGDPAEEKKEEGKTAIKKRALGAATAEAAKQAADMAVQSTDVFIKTGEWAWRKFNEQAREEGYDDIFAWLSDCVHYWQVERQGWQPVLEALRATEQEVEILLDKVEMLTDMRAIRQELLDAILVSNLAGHPITAEQLSVLVLGRVISSPPAPEPMALPSG